MKKKAKKYEADFSTHAKKELGGELYNKAVKRGLGKAYELRLKLAREMLGLKQTDLKGLTQPDVSKIEKRKDMKISTLDKYAKAMGMKVKISLVSDDDETHPIAIYG